MTILYLYYPYEVEENNEDRNTQIYGCIDKTN
jgi:hypothetical protein